MESENKGNFLVLITGQIETAEFNSSNNFYFKYSYVYGTEWSQIAGLTEGLSARCQKNCSQRQTTVALPIEATFKSTNPYGWPQIVISCYGIDSFGNDIIEGYGAIHIPTTPGRTVQKMSLFVPEASTKIQKFIGWITGKRAEFIDPRTVASGHGRLVTRVRSQGIVYLNMQIVLKDLRGLGYNFTNRTAQSVPELPLRTFEDRKKKQVLKNEDVTQPNTPTKETSPTRQQRRTLPVPPSS